MTKLATSLLLLATVGVVHAQSVPEGVRLLHPSCAGPIDWAALEAALRVELRSMGSDLAESHSAPARLSLDAGCEASATEVLAILGSAASGRSIEERIPLGDPSDPERERVLAALLSELVHTRWAGVVEAAPTATVAAIDLATVRAEIAHALPLPVPPAPVPREFFDAAVAVTSYPAGANAIADVRLGGSLPLTGLIRLGLEIAGAGGVEYDALGDVLLTLVSAAASLRLGHSFGDAMIEAGPRVDVGWAHAEGFAGVVGAHGVGLDSTALALGADLRARVRIDGGLWFVAGAEVGAALVGLDARAAGHRIAAQLGPRVAVMLGLSWQL